jgi:hypothetical protein
VVDVLLHLQGKLGIATATTLDLRTGFYFQASAVPKIDNEINKINIKGALLSLEELGISTDLGVRR